MTESTRKNSKVVLIIIWIITFVCLFLPGEGGVVGAGRLLFWVLLAAHAIESAVFFRVLSSSGKPLGSQLVQTLLFGMVHIDELRSAGPEAPR